MPKALLARPGVTFLANIAISSNYLANDPDASH